MKRMILAVFAVALLVVSACSEASIEDVEGASYSTVKTKAYGDKSPIATVVIETNLTNPLVALNYTFSNGDYFFDVVELFAAGITMSGANPTLSFGSVLTTILGNPSTYIIPLHNAGIKVVLLVQGNWEGIGVSNMTDSQAQAFAQYLAYLAYTVGLDGFSFDDEYANYSGSLVSGSFGRVISYLRDALDEYGMEDALINVFQYGNYGSTQITSSDGALIDYAYNSYFGTWSGSSSIAGVTNAHWAPLSINLGTAASSSALSTYQYYGSLAADGGYGAVYFFNLPSGGTANTQAIINAVSVGAFGVNVYYQ